MVLVRTAIVWVLTLVSFAARAAEPTWPDDSGAPEPKVVTTETNWYAGQMGAVYAGTIGLIALNIATDAQHPTLRWSAAGSFTLGASVLHAVHGNYQGFIGSLALRGAFLVTAVGLGGDCVSINGGDTPDNCALVAVLMFAELATMPLVDFGLARTKVQRSGSTDVSLSVFPPSGARPGLLALAGRF